MGMLVCVRETESPGLYPGVSHLSPLAGTSVGRSDPILTRNKVLDPQTAKKNGFSSHPYPQHLPAQLQPCVPAAPSQGGATAQTGKGVCHSVSPGNSAGNRAREVLASAIRSDQAAQDSVPLGLGKIAGKDPDSLSGKDCGKGSRQPVWAALGTA